MPRIQSLCTSVILFGFLFPQPASAQDLVQFRLETTDLSSTPISSVQVGDDFLLHVTVEDLRDLSPGEGGVFSAYLDVLFDSEFVSVVSDAGNPLGFDVEFGPDYENGQSGNIDTSGLIDEVGAFDGGDPLGTDEATLFTVMLHADQAGQFDFIGDFTDVLPLHEVILYDFASNPVPEESMHFGTASITIVPEPSTLTLLWLGMSSLLGWNLVHRRRRSQTTG